MKIAVKSLLIVVGAVGLCSCESMRATDSDLDSGAFFGGQFVSPRNQALYQQYHGWRSEAGSGEEFIQRLNAYSSN